MPVLRQMRQKEPDAARRRVWFLCVQTDGKTPATGENGQQPQISIDGANFASAGIGVLVSKGNGHYYAELDQATLDAFPRSIQTRYARADAVLETPGDSVETVLFKTGDEFETGSIRAGGSSTVLNVNDAGLIATGQYTGATLVMVSGANKGESAKILNYVGTAGAKVITLAKALSGAGYAVGDLFIIIGA